jgi:putative ABC transport system permease protein
VARHKTRSALKALGIMIGIAAVVWVVAIGEAGAAAAEAQLHALGDNLVWVEAGSRNVNGVRSGTHGMTSLVVGDAEAILRDVPLVHRASPQVDGSVVIAHKNHNWTTRSRGVAPDYLDVKRWEIAEGVAFTDEDVENASNVCLVGETVRARLFGDASGVGELVRVAGQPFEVVGVLGAKGQSTTGQDQDDAIFLPYSTAIRKVRGTGEAWVDDIVCSATSADTVKRASEEISALIRERHRIADGVDDDFNIRHPEEIINAQLETQRTFEALLVSIASIALLVGGIGVMNVMLASVAQRTREIGIRLAIGAPAWAVQAQFLAESVILTTLGGALGIALSFAGSGLIGRLIGWSLSVPPESLVIGAGFSIIVGILFGFLPARRAAQLDPIKALAAQ